MNSATLILWTLPWEKARTLALAFDINAARIADPAERDSLDELVFRLRANPHPPQDFEDYVEP